MNRNDAEKEILEFIKPIFGFALKRCKSLQDAEDLSQEIILRAYRALTVRDDIDDIGKFIWTIAHNMLANYYRNASRESLGIPLDDIAETLASDDDITEETDCEKIARLQKEIAYLSKLQRRIVIAYYFDNKKQIEIADELDIPLGTVKWHLFEAKKELKRGMNTIGIGVPYRLLCYFHHAISHHRIQWQFSSYRRWQPYQFDTHRPSIAEQDGTHARRVPKQQRFQTVITFVK